MTNFEQIITLLKEYKEKSGDCLVPQSYVTANGVNLPIQVFLPDGDIHNRRTVLCIHGGGWNSCAITDNSPWDGGWMGNNAKYFT